MARQAEEMAKLTLAQEEEERSFLAEAQLTMAPGEFLQVTLLPTHPHIHGHSQPEEGTTMNGRLRGRTREVTGQEHALVLTRTGTRRLAGQETRGHPP